MSLIHWLSVSLAVAAAAGCTRPHDVTVAYAAPHPGGTGAIDVQLNNASGALSVTVNDALVVDRKYSRKARIEGLPPGPAHIHVATGGGCEQAAEYDRDVEVIPGASVTVVLPGPQPNQGCMIYAGLTYVGMQIGLVAVAAITVAAAGASKVAHGK